MPYSNHYTRVLEKGGHCIAAQISLYLLRLKVLVRCIYFKQLGEADLWAKRSILVQLKLEVSKCWPFRWVGGLYGSAMWNTPPGKHRLCTSSPRIVYNSSVQPFGPVGQVSGMGLVHKPDGALHVRNRPWGPAQLPPTPACWEWALGAWHCPLLPQCTGTGSWGSGTTPSQPPVSQDWALDPTLPGLRVPTGLEM